MYTDTRPRIKYALPDGRVILVIHDHDQVPKPMISFQLMDSDPLWDRAQRVSGSSSRFILATLAVGL